MTWWKHPETAKRYDAIIADGAVRSGKTLSMSVSFVLWAMTSFDGENFAVCGKTVESCKRNVIIPLLGALGGMVSFRQIQSKNQIEASFAGRSNRFYIFGGKDEGSAALIQGVTLAGVLLDEVALMPQSFVDQALARCSVEASRFWFNCNPEHPQHWFYKDWIQKADEKHALYLHFTMDDNPTLAEKIKDRYRSLYSGVFYDRFIRGMWVAATGIVYPMFNKELHVVPAAPRAYSVYYISCDYGTVNPMSMGLWGECGGVWYRIREYYWASRETGWQKTDDEYYAELEALAGDLPVRAVIVDPSAASFIELIRRKGRFRVRPANNDVLDGIRQVAACLTAGRIKFNDCCTATFAEFPAYVWDDKATGDKPVKENDHAMDDIRYMVRTVIMAQPGIRILKPKEG